MIAPFTASSLPSLILEWCKTDVYRTINTFWRALIHWFKNEPEFKRVSNTSYPTSAALAMSIFQSAEDAPPAESDLFTGSVTPKVERHERYYFEDGSVVIRVCIHFITSNDTDHGSRRSMIPYTKSRSLCWLAILKPSRACSVFRHKTKQKGALILNRSSWKGKISPISTSFYPSIIPCKSEIMKNWEQLLLEVPVTSSRNAKYQISWPSFA